MTFATSRKDMKRTDHGRIDDVARTIGMSFSTLGSMGTTGPHRETAQLRAHSSRYTISKMEAKALLA